MVAFVFGPYRPGHLSQATQVIQSPKIFKNFRISALLVSKPDQATLWIFSDFERVLPE